MPHASVPAGRSAADNQEVRRHGTPRAVRLHRAAALGSRAGARDHRLRARDEDRGRPLLGADGRRCAAGPRAHQLHAAAPHRGARLHRGRAAVHGQHGVADRAPATCRSSRRICSRSRGSGISILIPTAEVPLTNLHRGEILDGRQLPLRYTAYTPVLPQRGRFLWCGCAWADPAAPVRQGRADGVHHARRITCRAGAPDQRGRGSAAAARAAVPHHAAVRRRHGVCVGQDLRHRSVAARGRTRTGRFPPAATPKRFRRVARASSTAATAPGRPTSCTR